MRGGGVSAKRGVAAVLAAVGAMALASPALGATNGRIAFQVSVDRFPQVFTINADGTGLTQVTRVPASDPEFDPGGENPSWSPDGTTIAFDTGNRKGVNLWTVNPDGSSLIEVPLGVGDFNGNPAYSPDGSRISFDWDRGFPSKQHGIFIANADGSGARRLTIAPRTVEAHDTESQWSPDGTRIAFTRVSRIGRAAVFMIGVDGTGLRRLTPWRLDAASPDWSPDGTRILFNTHFDPRPGQSANLYSMRPDGSRRRALTQHRGGRAHSFRPSWAPDGSRIVFARYAPARKGVDLYTMKPDGTGVTRLTDMPRRFAVNPDWGIAPSPTTARTASGG
jgi:TolB protein